MGESVEFPSRAMQVVMPSKPEQHNYSDCGIYLLRYLETIFKR